MQRIIPAILTKDKNELDKKIREVSRFSQWAHVDIMDGNFVDNKTINIEDLKEYKNDLFFELHLMVTRPMDYFKACKDVGAKRVVVHYEALDGVDECINKAKEYSFDLFIALNPDTVSGVLVPYVDDIQGVLIMSVFPGFGGQDLISETLEKAAKIKTLNSDIVLAIDGGVKLSNINQICEAGFDYANINSGLFAADNIQDRFKQLTQSFVC